jgi:glutathione S-transferase/rhodanese-related sulfurtransferase
VRAIGFTVRLKNLASRIDEYFQLSNAVINVQIQMLISEREKMNRNNRTLAFLAKHYHPFTHFTSKMLKSGAGDALRIFDIKAGETFSICSSNQQADSLFVIEGIAYFSDIARDKQAVTSGQIDYQPIMFSNNIDITTDTNATVCHVDSTLIYEYLSLKAIADSSKTHDSNDSIERLMFLKSTKAFRNLPISAVEAAAKRSKRIHVNKNEIIIKQDTRADAFYILVEGQAEVWREKLEDDEPQMVALLGQGDTFGEEALITGGARNATIKMTSEGHLLELSKENFDTLVSTPALRSVSPEAAKAMADKGVDIIDVRFEEEYQQSFIAGSVLIPLPDLRNHIDSLDKDKEYLILCAVGLRSAAATLILRQQGINAILIDGGLKAWPFDTAKTMDLELIMFDFCPFAQRGAISLKHNNIPHKLTYLDPNNLPRWFDEVSPFGKVPILRVDGKTTIFESSVINELIASISNKKMLPADPVERSVCRSWIEFGSTMLSQLTGMISAADKTAYTTIHNDFLKNLHRLEEQMKHRSPFFSGNLFTLVDSTYAPLFMRMEYLNKRMDLYSEDAFPKVTAWAQQLSVLDSVKESIPSAFDDIYQKFIQNRGAEGYLMTMLKY